MMDGLLGMLVAVGLGVSLLGTLRAIRATPIVGGDPDGYLSIEGAGQLEHLVSSQRTAWRLLLVGFGLQLLGVLGLAVHAILLGSR